MATYNDVSSKIEDIINDQIKVDEDTFDDDTCLREDVGLDRVEILGILVEIECEFDVDLDDVDYFEMDCTIRNLTEEVLSRMEERE